MAGTKIILVPIYSEKTLFSIVNGQVFAEVWVLLPALSKIIMSIISGQKDNLRVLRSGDLYSFNSVSNSLHIYPVTKSLAITGKKINIAVDPISMNGLKLNY